MRERLDPAISMLVVGVDQGAVDVEKDGLQLHVAGRVQREGRGNFGRIGRGFFWSAVAAATALEGWWPRSVAYKSGGCGHRTPNGFALKAMSQQETAEHRVVSVQVLDHLRLAVRFRDGLTGDVILRPSHLRGVFEVLREPALFAQVSCKEGFVEWPGEIDLAPDAMYDEICAHGQWILD